MRDGLMLSCEGLAGEPASAVGAVAGCLPPAFVDCLLDSALEPVLDATAQRGVPDEVFRSAAGGGDRGYARSLRRANAKPDPGQVTLFSEQVGYAHSDEALAKSLAKIGRLPGGASADDRRQTP